MNMLEATLERRNGSLAARLGDQELTLPDEVSSARPALRGYDGRTVALGIRPENLRESAGDGARLRGNVLLTEALGSERLVHVELEATPVVTEEVLEVASDADAAIVDELRSEARERRTTVVGRFDAGSRARAGDGVELAVDPRKLHFFDVESGLGIY